MATAPTRPLLFLVPAQLTDAWMWKRLAARAEGLFDFEYVEPQARDVDLATYERDIRGRVERASTERRVALAGTSLGAWLVARIAASLPRSVAHAFILSGLVSMTKEMNAARLETASALESGALDLRDLVSALVASVASADERDAELDGLLERQLAALGAHEIARQLRETAPLADASGAVPPFDVPTTIVHGTRDGVIPFSATEETARIARRSRVVPIDSTSHLLAWTRPEEMVRELRRALDES